MLFVIQQDDEIGAIFRRLHLRQLGTLDARFGVCRQLEPQRLAQELSCEAGPIAEQQQQAFMQL